MSSPTNKPLLNHGPIKKKTGFYGSIVSNTLQHQETISEDTMRNLTFKLQQKDARIRELEMYGVEKNELLRQREMLNSDKKKFQAELSAFQSEKAAKSQMEFQQNSTIKCSVVPPEDGRFEQELKIKNDEIEELKLNSQRKVAEVLTELENIKKELQSEKTKILDLENTNQSQNKQLSDILEQNEKLNSKITDLTCQNEGIEKEKEDSVEKQKELENKILRLETTISEMEKSNNINVESMNNVRLDQIKAEISEEISKREKLESENLNLKAEIDQLKTQNENLQTEKARTENDDVDVRVRELEIKIDEREKEIVRLEEMNQKLQKYCVDVNKEIQKNERSAERKIEEFLQKEKEKRNENEKTILEMRNEIESRRNDGAFMAQKRQAIISSYEKRLEILREKGREQEQLKTALLLGEKEELGGVKDNVLKMMISAIIVALKMANPKYEATKETVVSLFNKIQEERIDVMEWPSYVQAFFEKEIE
ncbi:GRIP1-associated protein, putative [Entamoeba invadens IP1]|uniref:GRIP1-associated protein, putative n=1 Tax=Entamoeba invadens IP1 TaxID=370355 RepID=A0A0A1UE61_ENTIV|nr:GRIP1-associated protein, putative [Entamoeba invadens IP1]ELP94777.1 GRIP1-associated protein, putative [Entamoeba invadens IP1]|eukprot:XP_004261548.1 GRIP1-associated protein, putative [Entamoeba invadens IP1]